MPQFDPTYFASQVFWLIVTFGILYWLMAKIALPRIGDILEVRQDRIAADLDRAEQLKREAEQARETYEKALADARSSAQALLADAQQKANAEAAQKLKELDDRLADKIRGAEETIASAKTDAMESLTDIATEAAAAASGKLLDQTVEADEAKAAVEAVLKEGRG